MPVSRSFLFGILFLLHLSECGKAGVGERGRSPASSPSVFHSFL